MTSFISLHVPPKNLPSENPWERYTVHKNNNSNTVMILEDFWMSSQYSILKQNKQCSFCAADLTPPKNAPNHSDPRTNKKNILPSPSDSSASCKGIYRFLYLRVSRVSGITNWTEEFFHPSRLKRHPQIPQVVKESILRRSDTSPPQNKSVLRVIWDSGNLQSLEHTPSDTETSPNHINFWMRPQDRFLDFQVLCVVHPMFLGLHTENLEACKGLWLY